MESGLDREKLMRYKAILAKHLSDPLKLRLSVVAVLGVVAIAGVYMPLSNRIAQNQSELAAERKRHQSIADVEKLRKQVEVYRSRIRQHSDTNEWVQYILHGLREFPVKLRDMESKELRPVGPYAATTLAVEVEGIFGDLKRFVAWLESSRRVLRIDSVRFEKRPGCLRMKVTVLGLIRKNASKA